MFRKWFWRWRGRRFNRRVLRYAIASGLRVKYVKVNNVKEVE